MNPQYAVSVPVILNLTPGGSRGLVMVCRSHFRYHISTVSLYYRYILYSTLYSVYLQNTEYIGLFTLEYRIRGAARARVRAAPRRGGRAAAPPGA